jgi:hypothetical protein
MKNVFLTIIVLFSVGICIAQQDEPFPELKLFSKYCSKFSLDEKPSVPADTDLIAIWKMKEDVDRHNYFVLERYNYYAYVFTYMNQEGANRTYENVYAFFSKIGNVDFINVSFYDYDTKSGGYFFLKITERERGWNMTLSLVADTTLKDITSREALRERIAKNVNNPNFYGKPVHFHKILPLMYCK